MMLPRSALSLCLAAAPGLVMLSGPTMTMAAAQPISLNVGNSDFISQVLMMGPAPFPSNTTAPAATHATAPGNNGQSSLGGVADATMRSGLPSPDGSGGGGAGGVPGAPPPGDPQQQQPAAAPTPSFVPLPSMLE